MSSDTSASEGEDTAAAAGEFAECELVGLDLVGDASPEFDSCPKNMNFFPGSLGVVGVLDFSLDASTWLACLGLVFSIRLGELLVLPTRIAPAVLGRTL